METNARDIAKRAGLTPMQTALIELLLRQPAQPVARATIMTILGGTSEKTIDSHVMRMRRKLRDSGINIEICTVKGIGFMATACDTNLTP